jgi:glycine hydroxymethyltransferase
MDVSHGKHSLNIDPHGLKPWQILAQDDPEIFGFIESEFKRQISGLEMIASENFASPAVIAAMANVFANKYAEGLPHKRYYGGCEVVDAMEEIAIDRARSLFKCKFANVQPHSGAQANAAVYLALAKPGDRILGLDLSHGGHLTHGSKVNFSGLIYESHFYGLKIFGNSAEGDHLVDMDQVRRLAKDLRPKILIAGASAYPRILDFEAFRSIADEVGAYLVVDMAHIAGLVAADLHPSPLPYAHVVTTTTHKTLRGPRGGLILWNDESLTKDLNKAVFPGIQGGPLEHIIAAKAVCFREAMGPKFQNDQLETVRNASTFADELLGHGFKLVTGGTDNHLVLINLLDTPVSGKQFEEGLGEIHIAVNKNTVPGETRSPFVTSGLRAGTPALTSRGFRKSEMVKIAKLFKLVFDDLSKNCLSKNKDQYINEVHELTRNFPLYPEWSHEVPPV